ncbi:hypothetical protein IPC1517_04625 [Pseudomonas aeruginosa]|nr:hypothetical protein IPC1517_04625 [Pseudomonas aeruginosa]
MDGLVLSGNRSIVLSGNELSCYQATKSAANPRQHWVFAPSNFPNLISLTFSRETPLRWITATRPPTQQQPGFPTRRARP